MSGRIARDWIRTVESAEALEIRNGDIYPRLRQWGRGRGRVLEVGAGQGACSEMIESAEYTGLEPSPVLLARARERYPQRRFVAGAANAMPFAHGEFDAVFSVAVWHLLSDLIAPARELRRVLHADGNFLIITANPDQYSAWTALYSEPLLDGVHFVGTASHADGTTSRESLYLHRLDDLLASLTGAGLQVRSLDRFRQDRFLAIEGGAG